jgi:type IV secretion system protein VirB5
MKVKTLKRSAVIVVLSVGLATSNVVLAIDMVIDMPALAYWAQQMGSWANQLNQMKSQLTQQTNTYKAMTGNRGLGNVLPLANSVRNYLPQGASELQGVLNNSTSNNYSGMAGQIQALVTNNSILSNGKLSTMNLLPSQQKLITDGRTNTAASQSIASQGMANASARFYYLQSLMNQINTTNDPKTIAELQARIAAENTMTANEQIKLQQTNGLMQSQNAMLDQQKRELAIQQTGNASTLQQPDLSQITFN